MDTQTHTHTHTHTHTLIATLDTIAEIRQRPSSAALRVNDPRTVSKVVCPRPPRTSEMT
jgi:hypothetical protein